MITLQHTLVSYIAAKGDEERFKKELPYVLLPDAIRMYTRDRQYSHFEQGKNGDVSWMSFPLNVRHMDQQTIAETDKHKVDAEFIPKCCIGEETILSAFEEHNKHLPDPYFNGVASHLIQDRVFDAFVRSKFDCTDQYEDRFRHNGTEYDGPGFRKLIADTEQQGYYTLAKYMYDKYGITANQEWIDSVVVPSLQESYPPDMAENTHKYMKIDPEINELITKHDFSKVEDFIIPQEEMEEMYQEAYSAIDAYQRPEPMERQGVAEFAEEKAASVKHPFYEQERAMSSPSGDDYVFWR